MIVVSLREHFPASRCEYKHERRAGHDVAEYEARTCCQCWATALWINDEVRGVSHWEIKESVLGQLDTAKEHAERRLAIELTMLDEIHGAVTHYYRRPGNEVGGPLHLVLDDYNLDDASIDFCIEAAAERGDDAGVALGRAIRNLTRRQRRALVRRQWLSRKPETP